MKPSVAVLIMMLISLPFVSAVHVFPSGVQISGEFTLRNPLNVSLSAAVYMGYNVSQPGISFRPELYIVKNWTPGKSIAFPYLLNCSKPGNYTLRLVFKGIGVHGTIYRFEIPVSIRVVRNPIQVSSPAFYVQGSPSQGMAFNGQRVTASITVTNIADLPLPVKVNMTVERNGSVLIKEEKSITYLSGSDRVSFTFTVPWFWKSGIYRVFFIASSPYGRASVSYPLHVSPGVSLVNVSLQNSEVFLGESNVLYVTVISQRIIRVNLTLNGRVKKTLNLGIGSSLTEIRVNATRTGIQRIKVELLHGSIVIGAANVSYSVLAPPKFSGINASAVPGSVSLNVTIVNPNPVKVSAELLVGSSSIPLLLNPGTNRVSVNLSAPQNSTLSLKLRLISSSVLLDSVTETIHVPALGRTSTSGTSSSSSSASSAPQPVRISAGWMWSGAITAGLIVAVSLLFFYIRSRGKEETYVSPWEAARKPRERRKKPKRPSPLGSFRRPRKPEVKGGKELPKSREKKRTGKKG